MAALPINSDTIAFLSLVNQDLEDAFSGGVVNIPTPPTLPTTILAPLPMYNNLNTLQRAGVKDSFRSVIAALMDRLGGKTVVIGYNKSSGGTGTMTFVNGILTAST